MQNSRLTSWKMREFHQLNGHEFEQAPGVGDGQSMGSQRVGHD